MIFDKFIHQPTTIAGLATLAGTAEAMLSGHMTWQAAIPVAIGAIVAIVIPDNTALQQDAETLAATAIKIGAEDRGSAGRNDKSVP